MFLRGISHRLHFRHVVIFHFYKEEILRLMFGRMMPKQQLLGGICLLMGLLFQIVVRRLKYKFELYQLFGQILIVG